MIADGPDITDPRTSNTRFVPPHDPLQVRAPLTTDPSDLQKAYERGRLDQRRGRKRRPVLMTFLFLAAAIGIVLVVMAAMNGSFGQAGGVVDENLAVAADRAEPIVREAATDAGQTLRDAGQSVKESVTPDRDSAPR